MPVYLSFLASLVPAHDSLEGVSFDAAVTSNTYMRECVRPFTVRHIAASVCLRADDISFVTFGGLVGFPAAAGVGFAWAFCFADSLGRIQSEESWFLLATFEFW